MDFALVFSGFVGGRVRRLSFSELLENVHEGGMPLGKPFQVALVACRMHGFRIHRFSGVHDTGRVPLESRIGDSRWVYVCPADDPTREEHPQGL